MTLPPNSALDAAIIDAEARGDWHRADELNAAKLREVHARTDHNGQARPPREDAAADTQSAPAAPPPGSLDGGARPHTGPRVGSLDAQLADATARGDDAAVDRLNVLKLGQAFTRQRAGDLSPTGL